MTIAEHCYLWPYLDYLADSRSNGNGICLVLDQGEADDSASATGLPVVGYILGTASSAAFVSWMADVYLPTLDSARFPAPAAPPMDAATDRRSALLYRLHHPLQLKHGLVASGDLWRSYPGHLHVDIDARFQGHGHGQQLVNAFVAELRNRHCAGVHLGTDAANARTVRFYEKCGFRRYGEVLDGGTSGKTGEQERDGWEGRVVYLVQKLGEPKKGSDEGGRRR